MTFLTRSFRLTLWKWLNFDFDFWLKSLSSSDSYVHTVGTFLLDIFFGTFSFCLTFFLDIMSKSNFDILFDTQQYLIFWMSATIRSRRPFSKIFAARFRNPEMKWKDNLKKWPCASDSQRIAEIHAFEAIRDSWSRIAANRFYLKRIATSRRESPRISANRTRTLRTGPMTSKNVNQDSNISTLNNNFNTLSSDVTEIIKDYGRL